MVILLGMPLLWCCSLCSIANGDYEGIEESVKTALDAGVTTFDTSDIYGWYGVDGEGRSNELFAEVLLKNVSDEPHRNGRRDR